MENIVGNYAETHLELLKEARKPLGYIDYEDIDKITFAEVRESDEFIINNFSVQEGILTVKYEMPAGILAKNDEGSICFHVTTWCTGEVEMYFVVYKEAVYILDENGIMAFNENLDEIWRKHSLAIDGVIFQEMLDDEIMSISCEMDPPGG